MVVPTVVTFTSPVIPPETTLGTVTVPVEGGTTLSICAKATVSTSPFTPPVGVTSTSTRPHIGATTTTKPVIIMPTTTTPHVGTPTTTTPHIRRTTSTTKPVVPTPTTTTPHVGSPTTTKPHVRTTTTTPPIITTTPSCTIPMPWLSSAVVPSTPPVKRTGTIYTPISETKPLTPKTSTQVPVPETSFVTPTRVRETTPVPPQTPTVPATKKTSIPPKTIAPGVSKTIITETTKTTVPATIPLVSTEVPTVPVTSPDVKVSTEHITSPPPVVITTVETITGSVVPPGTTVVTGTQTVTVGTTLSICATTAVSTTSFSPPISVPGTTATTTPHIGTTTPTKPVIFTPTTMTPHVGTPTTTMPHIRKTTSTTNPIILTPTTTTPHVGTPTTTMPHVRTTTTSTPHIATTTTSTASITPTPSTTVTPTPSVCPACYHKGKYFGAGQTWKEECNKLSCKLVGNPCLPEGKAPQIIVDSPVCPSCPKGFEAKARKDKCCPECVPTEKIPDVCKVKSFGKDNLRLETTENGLCTSLKKYKLTGCAGVCGSSMKATLGGNIVRPNCKCCQPKNVKKHKVTLIYKNCQKIKTTFYEIQNCSCKRTRCDSIFNTNQARDEEEPTTKKSLLKSIEDMDTEMDDDIARRQRRSLLNDLALVHAKKKRK